MKIPRSARARATPSSRTRLWSSGGTAERPIRSTKTNRLSTERLYSVIQPAKNWPAARGWAVQARVVPNSTARATAAMVPSAASRNRVSRARRPLRIKSAVTSTIRPATVTPQAHSGTWTRSMTWPPLGSARPLAAVERANLGGPGDMRGGEHASKRAIVAENQRVAHGIQRCRDCGPHGHAYQQAGQRLIRRRRHDVRDGGGNLGQARRVTAPGWKGG